MEIPDTVDDVFEFMVNSFTENKNKNEMINIMKDFCKKKKNEKPQIYELKKKLEIDFSEKVNCQYCYLSETPIDYGCDLREIFYDRENNSSENGKKLLKLFGLFSRRMDKKWHIMTDIDDTLYANTEHGTYIAGSDKSWEQKKPYPGIEQFYKLFHSNSTKCSDYTTILSATPGCLKRSKLKDSKKLLHKILGEHGYGFIQGVESKGQILSHTGDIINNCVGHLCGRSKPTYSENISELFQLFGNTKFERFQQYSTIFPENKLIFIGDNGQGDVLAGIKMIDKNPTCHVFIRRVCEDGQNFKIVPEEDYEIERLHFFNNYYDLAKEFQTLGIFNEDNVEDIKNSIIDKVSKSKFRDLYSSVFNESKGGKRKTRKTRKIRKTRKNKK